MTAAAQRWRDQLAAWAIPPGILAAAPTDPHAFAVDQFLVRPDRSTARAPEDGVTRTHRRAADRLPDGGSVLDVGCGGGAGSVPLAWRAGRLIGADESAEMLAAFAAAAERAGVAATTVQGRWPDIAGAAPAADVVVCLHVVYNVAPLAAFVDALAAHARRRVVLELPVRHPLDWLRPYWRAVHGIDRPDGPTAADALDVVAEAGHDVRHERWRRPMSLAAATATQQVTFIARRLCVGTGRHTEIADLVRRFGTPPHRQVVTAWWEV